MPVTLHQVESLLSELATPLAVQLPSGQRIGPHDAVVSLHLPDLGSLVSLGMGQVGALGEGLVEGRIQLQGNVRDLMAAAADLLRRHPERIQGHAHWWSRMLHHTRSRMAHTAARNASQIEFHYDVSDDFYALWLDPLRIYSCAYFRDAAMSLAQAQQAKLDHICRKLMLRPGERFLDVGSGWGGLLLWAAEHYGVDGTGITLSRHQHAYVQQLIADKGLQGRVRVELCDYRALAPAQPFDKIASVGMFEHVGHAQMVGYFRQLHALLRPGGLVLNHGITAGGVGYNQLGAGMGDFIEKYIFPGGELLHTSVVLHDMAEAGLEMVDTENLRPHYARTLWAWSDALEARSGEALAVLAQDTDAERAGKTLRAYQLYLAGSAMGFEQGWLALHQILATRPDGDVRSGSIAGAQSEYPFQRAYIYPGA